MTRDILIIGGSLCSAIVPVIGSIEAKLRSPAIDHADSCAANISSVAVWRLAMGNWAMACRSINTLSPPKCSQ